jgi:hypothetical protein
MASQSGPINMHEVFCANNDSDVTVKYCGSLVGYCRSVVGKHARHVTPWYAHLQIVSKSKIQIPRVMASASEVSTPDNTLRQSWAKELVM